MVFYCNKNTSINFAAGRGFTWPIGTLLDLPEEERWVQDLVREQYIRYPSPSEAKTMTPVKPPAYAAKFTLSSMG